MKRYLIVCFSLIFFGCSYVSNDAKVFVKSGENVTQFNVEIAKTPQELATGLMNRKEILDNQGMLFLFPEPAKLTFWMKNTYVPLDMIFVDKDWKIVKIEESAQPCLELEDSKCPLYSAHDAQYVLEVKGGISMQNGFKEGDSISLGSSND